jgi:hypothetical protein
MTDSPECLNLRGSSLRKEKLKVKRQKVARPPSWLYLLPFTFYLVSFLYLILCG